MLKKFLNEFFSCSFENRSRTEIVTEHFANVWHFNMDYNASSTCLHKAALIRGGNLTKKENFEKKLKRLNYTISCSKFYWWFRQQWSYCNQFNSYILQFLRSFMAQISNLTDRYKETSKLSLAVCIHLFLLIWNNEGLRSRCIPYWPHSAIDTPF